MITFDNRDAGGSTRLEGTRAPNVLRAIARALRRRPVTAPYTLDDMVADTVGLLDALGIERVHVVGASMGGMISQLIAARHPARVLSLTSIMSNSGNPDRKMAFGSWKALRAIIRRPPPPDDHEAVVRHLVGLFSVIGSPAFLHEIDLARPYFERAPAAACTARARCARCSPFWPRATDGRCCAASLRRRWYCTAPPIRSCRLPPASTPRRTSRAPGSKWCPAWVTTFRRR